MALAVHTESEGADEDHGGQDEDDERRPPLNYPFKLKSKRTHSDREEAGFVCVYLWRNAELQEEWPHDEATPHA